MNERRGFLAYLGAGLASLFGVKNAKAYATPYKTGFTNLQPLTAKLEKFEIIPRIRLWKLGSLEHKVWPKTESLDKLTLMLSKWDGKDDLDIIWGPDLELISVESNNDDIDVIQLPDGQKHIIVRGDKTQVFVHKEELK